MTNTTTTTTKETATRNILADVLAWKRFAAMWGCSFRFNSKEVAFDLPEKSAAMIRSEFEFELFQEGGADFKKSDDGLCYSVSL
jgi:hypothetical protein